ncbi:MAG: hypothetical protein R3E90_01360 [Marinicella sp.]
MKLLLAIALLLSPYFEQITEKNPSFQFPETDALASHLLNLIEAGQINDNGHLFKAEDLYIGRVDHVINLEKGITYIEYQTKVNCGVEYNSEEPDPDSPSYYLALSIGLDQQGQMDWTAPSLSTENCGDETKTFNNDHISIKPEIPFKPDFTLLNNQADMIKNIIHKLITDKKISQYGHIFTEDEVTIHTISMVEYIEHNHNLIKVIMIPKCDIKLQVLDDHESSMSQLYIRLSANGDFEKAYSFFGAGSDVACKNPNKT